jgi:PAS domain S-box-containing protein
MMARMVESPASAEALFEQAALFDMHPQPMWVVDAGTLAFLAVNQAAERLYGYSKDEFLGMSAEAIRPAEDVDDLRRVFADWSNTCSQRIWRHRKKSGEVITVRVTSFSLEFSGRRARLAIIDELSGTAPSGC